MNQEQVTPEVFQKLPAPLLPGQTRRDWLGTLFRVLSVEPHKGAHGFCKVEGPNGIIFVPLPIVDQSNYVDGPQTARDAALLNLPAGVSKMGAERFIDALASDSNDVLYDRYIRALAEYESGRNAS